MKVEVIPNKGPASMSQELGHNLDWASSLAIGSAFVTKPSLSRISAVVLAKTANDYRPFSIRLLVGLYQRFTPPSAIAMAMQLEKKYSGRFAVRISRNPTFHWKLYIFAKGLSSRRLYVGSANFTEQGCSNEGELSVKITANHLDEVTQTLEREFDLIWSSDKKSFSPTKQFLRDYRSCKRPPRFISHPLDDPISRLLDRPKRIRTTRPKKSKQGRVMSVFVERDLLPETKELIEEETNWDRRGLCYTTGFRKGEFERLSVDGSIILLVDQTNNGIEIDLRRVEDSVQLKTPDGKYFLAHLKIPRSVCRKYSTVAKQLRKVGLTKSRLRKDSVLNKVQTRELCRLLRVNIDRLFDE